MHPNSLLKLEKFFGAFGLIAAIDIHSGKIVKTICDPLGRISKISEVFISSSPSHQEFAYLGIYIFITKIIYYHYFYDNICNNFILGSWSNDYFVRLPKSFLDNPSSAPSTDNKEKIFVDDEIDDYDDDDAL
jgi:hypothetical protein